MSSHSNFARVFLNQDVAVSSPEPQPIDDIAGMRATQWDDSPPRAVQVVFRHGATDLMLHAALPKPSRNDGTRGATSRSQIKMLKAIGSNAEYDSRLSDGTIRTKIGRQRLLLSGMRKLCELLLFACSLQP